LTFVAKLLVFLTIHIGHMKLAVLCPPRMNADITYKEETPHET
jgi:hypothetical protein